MQRRLSEVTDKLLATISAWDGENETRPEFQALFGRDFQEIGSGPFIVNLFCNYSDRHPQHLMIHIAFMWKELKFTEWLIIAKEITHSRNGFYTFRSFAAEILHLDIAQILQMDSSHSLDQKIALKRNYPDPVSIFDSKWERELLEEQAIDPSAFWSKLNVGYEDWLKSTSSH